MMHQHQQTTALSPHHINPPPPPPPLIRAPHSQQQLPSPLSLGSLHHVTNPPVAAFLSGDHPAAAPPLIMPVAAAASPTTSLGRVRLSDLVPYDGVPSGPYLRAVEALSGSLMRHNAAVIELGTEDASLLRCGLESARLYFRSRAHSGGSWGKGSSRGVYMYRAGRALEDIDSSPPCMADVFRCMGKAARASLSAIARHLRLRSDIFNHLLDDNPLPTNEASSSVLVASYSHVSLQNGKGAIGGGKLAKNFEVEKGLVTLVSSDAPGLQVCDPNGRWYLADCGSAPGDLLLLTGKALSHATAGLRPAALYRAATDNSPASGSGGRSSLAFRLMPQGNAILDCSPITAAGHVIPQSYVPISVSQFMDDLSADEDVVCNLPDSAFVARNNSNKEPSLRSVLSDSLSEDAGFSWDFHFTRNLDDGDSLAVVSLNNQLSSFHPSDLFGAFWLVFSQVLHANSSPSSNRDRFPSLHFQWKSKDSFKYKVFAWLVILNWLKTNDWHQRCRPNKALSPEFVIMSMANIETHDHLFL